MNEMNIYQRMAAITAELQTVAKNLTVQASKTSSYKAVSERDILDAVKPLEIKHGVYSYPISREVLESNLLENEKTFKDSKGSETITKSTTFMTRIKTVYRFVSIDYPEEYIETTTFAEGIDSQDKGSGKAMTYADKYALMKAYKISTGEDPDQTASEDVRYFKAKTTTSPVKASNALRQKLATLLVEHGIDVKQYAAEKGIGKDTPESMILECIAELEKI